MKTIKEIMDETHFSYRHIVGLCHENKIVYIKAGKKFLINYEKFIEYLNTGDGK
ncbi:MAG: helix-turn-helix domain-containing protein [Eubacterium sp.]|nr:helix-turn-helix domain-containing protein [Eubacterium sp.]